MINKSTIWILYECRYSKSSSRFTKFSLLELLQAYVAKPISIVALSTIEAESMASNIRTFKQF